MQMLLSASDDSLDGFIKRGPIAHSVGNDVVSLIASTTDAGYVNVDIKGGNMLIDHDMQVRIIDWDPYFTKRVVDVFRASRGVINTAIARVFLSVTMLGLLISHLEQKRVTPRLAVILGTLKNAMNNSSVNYKSAIQYLHNDFKRVLSVDVLTHYFHYSEATAIDDFFFYLKRQGLRDDDVPMFNGVHYTHETISACCTSGRRRIFTKSFTDAFQVTGYATIDDDNLQLPPQVSGIIGKDIPLESLKEYVAPYAVPFALQSGNLQPVTADRAITLQQQLSKYHAATSPLRRTLSPGALLTPALVLNFQGEIGTDAPSDTRQYMQDALSGAIRTSSPSSTTGSASSPTVLASSQTPSEAGR